MIPTPHWMKTFLYRIDDNVWFNYNGKEYLKIGYTRHYCFYRIKAVDKENKNYYFDIKTRI